ncbi:MAG: hypothetical protein WAM66_13130 [Acidobacteriaceae bacterium]
MRQKRALGLGLVFAICAAATAAAQLRYSVDGPVVLRDGAGSVVFRVTNPGPTPAPLALRVGPFTDDATQMAVGAPKVTFAWDAGPAIPPFIGPGATLRLTANVSGMSGASVASAPLLSGKAELGRLRVVEIDAPLDVSISGSGGADSRLVLNKGSDATVRLKNGDGEAYPLDWAFEVDGKTLQSGELQLAAFGTSEVTLTPTDDLYSWRDNVRPSNKTGLLLLSLHGPPEIAGELLPARTLRMNLLMQKLSPSWTSVWSRIFMAILLLIGGLLSLVGNTVLPNAMRKMSLRRQTSDFGDRVNSLSKRVDAYLRTLLRMERKRVDLLLKRARAFSPASIERLETAAAGIDRLRHRLKAAERLDELRRRLDEASVAAPPSVTDDIDLKLQAAAMQLQSFALTEDEASAAGRMMDTAEASLTMATDTEALAQMTAENFRDLKVRQKLVPYAYYNDLKAALPGLFEMLNQPFDDPRNVTRQMMFAIDYGIAALQMAFDYAMLRVSAPAVAAVGESGTSARDRLFARQSELIALLGTLSWAGLRDMRALMQEMRENIYESDVLEAIATQGQAEIALNPRAVRPYQPVLFSIRFKDSRLNDAAAIRRLACTWDFPEQPLAYGWRICHFFTGSESRPDEGGVTVSARFESRKPTDASAAKDGRLLKNSLSATFELQKKERPSYAPAIAGGMRFLIAFGVALAALLAGALRELDKLDFVPAMIAVLAIGFAADSVKNLLSQTERKAEA